jgi:hypothetical protein
MRLLPWMFGVEARVGIGMKDLGDREPALRQSFDPLPGHPTPLAKTPERTKPAANHLEPKPSKTGQIPRNCMIVEVTPHKVLVAILAMFDHDLIGNLKNADQQPSSS